MMIIQSRKYLYDSYDQLITQTLDYLLSLQLPSGNFPSSEGKNNDDLIHFCHGATGAVPVLCKAYLEFNNPLYLEAAVNAGHVI